MTVTEQIQGEAMERLAEARRTMQKLMVCTGDWSAGTLLEVEFDALEESCREFGRCQFGPPPTPKGN